MAASFPTTIPAIQRVLPTDLMNSPGKEGDVLHNKLCDEVEALATVVGVTGSVVASTVEARLAEVQATSSTALSNGLRQAYQTTYDDIISRPPRLWPEDAIPHALFCEQGGYAWGHLGSDNRTLVRVHVGTRAADSGHQFPSGEPIVFVFAARSSVLVLTAVAATSTYNLYRASSVNAVALVHQIGSDGVTQHPYVSILDRGLDKGTIGGENALMFGTYNTGDTFGVVPGSAGDINYLAVSMDDGLTWAKINTWNNGTRSIQHIHVVRFDAYRDNWWICTGDDNDKAMICRWDGSTVWPGNVTPAQLSGYSGFIVGTGISRWRAVDLLITDEWIESYTDTVSTVYGGIWRMRPDYSDSHRIDHAVYRKQHDGWSAVLCADGTHLWCDDCRADSPNDDQQHIAIYGSANGNKYYDIARIALTGIGAVVTLKGFFQDQNGLIWMSCQKVAGKGPYETTISRLSGTFKEEKPDNVAPAFFVNFATGSDANDGKTAATAWKTARKSLGGNVVTHGARVILSAGESIENGVSTIDYAANATPAKDTTKAVQISGQGRGSTTITLSGATEGWRDSNTSKTWKVELSDLTFKQSDATKVCLWDQSTISGDPGNWILRDATVGDSVTGASYVFYARTCKIDLIRSSVVNIQNSAKYCLYCSTDSEVNATSSIIRGGRSLQLLNANINLQNCSVVEFANMGLSINSGATIPPTIKNTIFDRSSQTSINNGSVLSITSETMNWNYFCTPTIGSVPAPILPVASATTLDDSLKPFSWSPIAQIGGSIGVIWDYNGAPFRSPPSIGAIQG